MLPKSKSSQALSKQTITLAVTNSKQYYINKKEIPFSRLEDELVMACKGIAEPTVVLRLASGLTIQDLVDVMQIGAKNKIKMVLATDKK